MSTTIEEQIVAAVAARMVDVNGGSFRSAIGNSVQIGIKKVDPSTQMPGCQLFPVYSENDIEDGSTYTWKNLSLAVEGLDTLELAENPYTLAAAMQADIEEAVTGPRFIIAFTAGSSALSADELKGKTLANVAATYTTIIEKITISSGSLGLGDAVGNLYCRRLVRFDTYATGAAAVSPGVATFTTGAITGQSPATDVKGNPYLQ
jgi:hypothetical protein